MNQLVQFSSLIEFNSYVLMGLIITCTLVCYLIVKPFVHWFIVLKQERILSYMICSFIVLICATSLGFTLEVDYTSLIKLTLFCVAIFGAVLVIIRLIQYIFKSAFT